MAIDIVLMVICSGLWLLGGQKHSWIRDLCIPLIIGLYFAITQHWLLGLLLFGACNIIRMGYGAYDPEHDDKPSCLANLTHDRNGWWIRAIVGGMYGISTMSVMLFFFHDPFSILKAVLYTIQNSIQSYLVCRLRLNIVATDLLVGISFGSIVLWF
jgi:hypothetical protein